MEPVVRYATREDLPRVNELRQQVSDLHAAGRPDIFRPGFCEALQQHVYQLFDAPGFDVIVACLGETICGFAAVQYVDRPESPRICAPAASTTKARRNSTKQWDFRPIAAISSCRSTARREAKRQTEKQKRRGTMPHGMIPRLFVHRGGSQVGLAGCRRRRGVSGFSSG